MITGLFFIILGSYNNLLFFSDIQFSLNLGWSLFFAYVAGIALIIIGATFIGRTINLNTSLSLKPYSTFGLALLTIGIFNHIIDNLLSTLQIEYSFSLHSLIVGLLGKASWFSPLGWIIGFAGWLILFICYIIKKVNIKSSIFSNILFYILSVGAIITFILTLFELSMPFLSYETKLFLYAPLRFYFIYIYPIGVSSLSFGWAIITSVHLNKSPSLFLILYITFLLSIGIILLIPI